jgi:hypothetical protein
MGADSYQGPGSARNLLAATGTLEWLTNPRLAWSFLTVADPDAWHPVMTYLNQRRAAEADFEVGGRHYTVYAHDWRAEPPLAWLDRMAERELSDQRVEALEAELPAPLLVLSEPEFKAAVRQALRDYTRPAALAANPLLRSRLATQAPGGAPATAATLQGLLREAAEQLRANPRDERLYRALAATFLQPAATQELAAERLGLPFSTYRYHLAGGLRRVTERLWRAELYGPDD